MNRYLEKIAQSVEDQRRAHTRKVQSVAVLPAGAAAGLAAHYGSSIVGKTVARRFGLGAGITAGLGTGMAAGVTAGVGSLVLGKHIADKTFKSKKD